MSTPPASSSGHPAHHAPSGPKSFVPGGTYDPAGPGQYKQFEAAEHMKTTEAGRHVNNVCGNRPSVLYSNSFMPDLVTSHSAYGCTAMSPSYIANDTSSLLPSCSACNGCSKMWDMRVFGLRPVSAPAYACGTPTAASVSGAESARGAMALGVNPLTTVGVGSSSPSRYAYGATMALKENLRANMHAACTKGSPVDCKTAAVQAQNLDNTVASYGTIVPTYFLPDATEFTGTFGGSRPGGF